MSRWNLFLLARCRLGPFERILRADDGGEIPIHAGVDDVVNGGLVG